jgi:hypothetical protein
VKKLYSHESLITVTHLANVLTAAGLRAEVRNTRLGGVLGEIPFFECWPELWVADEDHAAAERLLQEALAEPGSGASAWRCPACGETIEPQFAVCWRCGEPAPENSGP